MAQYTTAEDALGSITLAGRFIRSQNSLATENHAEIPIKYITVEPGGSYAGDTAYAKVLPVGMEDEPNNYTIIAFPTNGFAAPVTLIQKIDFTYGGSDAIQQDYFTILWRQ